MHDLIMVEISDITETRSRAVQVIIKQIWLSTQKHARYGYTKP